jgi:integral membrane sensor domain MASE1
VSKIQREALAFAVVAGLYVGAAKLGIALSVAHGVITPVWAPTGIALVAVLLFGPRLAFAVALGALIANVTSGASLPVALVICAGNALEALVGRALLLRVGFRPQLDRIRDVFALLLLAAPVSAAVAATNGLTALWVAGDISGSSYGSNWLLWWVGDGMGDVIVAPLLLVWATARRPRPTRAEGLEAAALLALVPGISSFVFLADYWRYPHLLFPLLVWAGAAGDADHLRDVHRAPPSRRPRARRSGGRARSRRGRAVLLRAPGGAAERSGALAAR